VAGESNTIRIGTQGTQTATYIAGIFNSSASGGTVEVSSTGKVGMVVSSARYKHDIRDIGQKSSNLLKLRPVSFRYNNDPAGTLQYGLVAEEVAKVYPELVVNGPDGKPITVRYLTVISLLLNELQKQARNNANLAAEVVALKASTARQITEVKASFEERLATLEQAMRVPEANDKLAAAFSR
jgi:hypothetical protein